MEFMEDYKWLVIGVIVLIISGVIYGLYTFRQSEDNHYLTVCSDEVDHFNLRITKIGGEVVFSGSVNLPFTMYLEDGNYLLESWVNINGTKLGYNTIVTLNRDKNVWMLV